MRRTEGIARLALSAVAVLTLASLPNTWAAHAAESVYAPFAFLVGEWEITPAGSQVPQAVTRFRWGPGQSYLLLETSLILNGKEEPHFEGMLMWNGVHKHLDMLLALDLKGGRDVVHHRLDAEDRAVDVRDVIAVDASAGPLGLRADRYHDRQLTPAQRSKLEFARKKCNG